MNVLVINCGSSSVKYAQFDQNESIIVKGKRERLGQQDDARHETHAEAIEALFSELGGHTIDAVGNHVVHGGESCQQSRLINDDVRATIVKHEMPWM